MYNICKTFKLPGTNREVEITFQVDEDKNKFINTFGIDTMSYKPNDFSWKEYYLWLKEPVNNLTIEQIIKTDKGDIYEIDEPTTHDYIQTGSLNKFTGGDLITAQGLHDFHATGDNHINNTNRLNDDTIIIPQSLRDFITYHTHSRNSSDNANPN